MPNLVEPEDTHAVSETENRTSCLTTVVRQSQSVAVSQTSAISVGALEGGGGAPHLLPMQPWAQAGHEQGMRRAHRVGTGRA